MLAAIPSVVLGLWGIIVLGPVVHDQFGPWLNDVTRMDSVLRDEADLGSTMFTAVLVLAIMIVPITAAVSRASFCRCRTDIKEGAIGLGLTRWEMVRGVILPYTRGGLISAVLLGGGRAVGEAIAVTQVIGTTAHLTANLFDHGRHAREPDRRPVPGCGFESPSRVAVLPGRDPARDLADRELRRAADRAALRHRAESLRWKRPLPPLRSR